MAESAVIEIRVPGRDARRVTIDRAVEVGRDCDGAVLADAAVAPRHLKLVASPVALSLVDLGSGSGTFVNGRQVEGRAVLEVGDVVRLGDTEIEVIARPSVARVRPERMAPRVTPVIIPGQREPEPEPPRSPGVITQISNPVFLGPIPKPGQPVFRNYTELPRRLPVSAWHAIRVVSVLAYIALVIGLFVRPAGALFAFFKVVVPLLPIVFFVAPGLWRNICPLAAANQAPRVLGITRGFTSPVLLRRYGYIIALVLFFAIASARIALFNTNGRATGILLAFVIVNAFLAGLFIKGKSGWCSSICPLLPLQRAYGQTPFITVPNSHCQPCVGCTKNCYDFKPQVAYQADLHDADSSWVSPRKLFAAALPGFVLGFFTLVSQSDLSTAHVYERLALYFLGSIASFYLIDALLPVTSAMLTALFPAVAINIFYWYAGVVLAESFQTVTGLSVPWARWPIRAVVLALTIIWMTRTYAAGRRFRQESSGGPALVQVGRAAARALANKASRSGVQVRFLPDDVPVDAEIGTSLLEAAERAGQKIEAGCRMGVCGADPVAVIDGMAGLTPADEDERNTLRRLGYAANTRMACCARLQSGPVQVSLTPEPGGPAGPGQQPASYDRSILSVVVIGNGIAGVTAADFLRRGHPDCEIHLVGREPQVLYNRMGISRLVYGRSAMQGLHLLTDSWYDEHGITAWLNTVATQIDPSAQQVRLGTGDLLYYDRLVLAMGSSSAVPPIEGFGTPGSFVMREAADAMAIRSYVQQTGARRAVVSGAGLLGLEAAYALLELGLDVTVLERGERLLARQVSARCSELVQAHFSELGIEVSYRAEAAALRGEERITTLVLADGTSVPCDVFLAAVGIRPNVGLAAAAGLAVSRGVLVDDRMQTSAPGVFAVGDVAEHNGMVLGLWPIAAKQAEVAAVNALGGDEILVAEVPATILKGVGLELAAIGQLEPAPGEEAVVVEDASLPSYRRLVLAGGRVVGAIVLGHHTQDLTAATMAVKQGLVLGDAALAAVRDGDWSVLAAGRLPADPVRAAV
jgi:NADPH-dependent 2,4-dienoyl-CoA reductase/sulfur reductase-like enzyme/ferredoxin/pSer/pThr/pTyr-binding forkhead associated (FHA) protein